MKYRLTIWIVSALFLSSCAVKPHPIAYGEDMCHYCSMTIVDKGHAAEVVTDKGKVYKFDAIECMLNFRRDGEVSNIELFLVNGLYSHGDLHDATSSIFLKCQMIPSPMGAYLSAFEEEEKAINVHREMGGDLFSWEELNSYFADNHR